MPRFFVTGFVGAVAVVLATASGCAVESADPSDPNASSSDEALTCTPDPVMQGISHGAPHSGYCLEVPYPKDMARVAKDVPWGALAAVASPRVQCVIKFAEAYCPAPVPYKTNVEWTDCYDGHRHYMDTALCNLPANRLVTLVNQCGAEAEVFQDAPYLPNADPNRSWLAVDPLGSGPHKN
jgi:hypothetical protein